MANVPKMFLTRVKQVWKEEFPFLEPVELKEEIPVLQKGSRYLCRKYLQERGVCYFIIFNMFTRRRGEFSINISVSPTETESILFPSFETPDPRKVGMYNIAKFLGVQMHQWALVDVDAEVVSWFPQLEGISSPPGPPEIEWRPSSFDLPNEVIIDEAICDINNKLRRYVFPVLQIEE